MQRARKAYYAAHRMEQIARSKAYAMAHRAERIEYMRMWRDKNRERLREYFKNYRAAHPPDKAKQYLYWRRHRLKSYGLTMEDYEALLRQQKGRCAICGRNSGNHRKTTAFQVDHDHKTGAVR